MSRSIKHFLFHYLEMVAAMVVGMVVLGGASDALLNLSDATTVRLVEMALAMTIPMVAWMRFRGHGWRACYEMTAAMLIPAAGALVLASAGLVEDEGTLLMFEHVAMFIGMFVAMLLRRDEYTRPHHRTTDEIPASMPGRRTDGSVRTH